MALSFESDANKAKANFAKHEISFEEASPVFGDPRSLTIPDPIHSAVEDHLSLSALPHRGKLLVVVRTEREYPHHQCATR